MITVIKNNRFLLEITKRYNGKKIYVPVVAIVPVLAKNSYIFFLGFSLKIELEFLAALFDFLVYHCAL